MNRTPGPVQSLDGLRVLVAGATGFIGRWTVRAFSAAGAEVHAVARDPSAAAGTAFGGRVPHRWWTADLSVPGAGADVVGALRPDVVVNAAGYGVLPGQTDAATLRRIDVELPVELGLAMSGRRRPDGGPVLVHLGSAAEYGTAGGALEEEGPHVPQSPYGSAKLAGTRALAGLAASAGTHCVVARPFTVYGAGESAGRLLPTLLAAARSNRSADLSAGTQQRDFTYVEDVADGLVRLAVSNAPPGTVVNLATGSLLTVREFALRTASVVAMPAENLRFGATAGGREEMQHEPVTTRRLERLLGWRPGTGVTDGVRRTVAALQEGWMIPR